MNTQIEPLSEDEDSRHATDQEYDSIDSESSQGVTKIRLGCLCSVMVRKQTMQQLSVLAK